MRTATYRYQDFDGSSKDGECSVHTNSDGFYVMGITGPGGCSKTKSPVAHWKPIRSAIEDLLGGRLLLEYKVVEDKRIDGYNPEFLGAKPPKAGEDY